eukprot:TRINITY_DN14269_c0_g1_i1.p1 TRINITY_DN14269_c0_g1~~TRINITY_DN14269_c0_g1_i1.p1  ORF type:complete len:461 (-),score=71.66 TRINITY_DN14269_c0_g1_i1:3-1385(-)
MKEVVEGIAALSLEKPQCEHGTGQVRKAVGVAGSRDFYLCGAKKGEKCNFFQWAAHVDNGADNEHLLKTYQFMKQLSDKCVNIFGRVHRARVTAHCSTGFIVSICVPNNTYNSQDPDGAEFYVLEDLVVSYSSKSIAKWENREQLVKMAKTRVPPGSGFCVYMRGFSQSESGTIVKVNVAIHANAYLNVSPRLDFPDMSHLPFRYLVVVDLEATCDYSPNPLVDPTKNSEIIEFPWVTFDTKTMKIVSETRYYIQPSFLDGVTPYCTALTGITKETVTESGESLESVLLHFREYVRDFFDDDASQFCFVTDGVWDLQVQLTMEAARKGLQLDAWFKQYFDVKSEFANFLPFFAGKKPASLAAMVRACKLEIFGQHHSGLDDCKTILGLVKYLLQSSTDAFTQPKQIPHNYDPLQNMNEWNVFDPCAAAGSWKCPACHVYNRITASRYCYFCKNPKAAKRI